MDKYEPGKKPVRRTVGGAIKLTIIGEESGARLYRSNVATILVGERDKSGPHQLRLNLNRSEAVAMRDALNRIIGTEL